MVIQLWQLVEAITILITIPVLALEYYWVILLGTSTRYPRDMASHDVRLESHPMVSVLIASFNEKFVIERTLDAVKQMDYPKDRLQVVIADDSNDQTVEVVDAKASELNSLGI
jgi:cellulose synthase/poly-beta-1,6-N-acetylglucosamine synthase-like glycosyltransferase